MTVSFASDIRPLFRDRDINCMRGRDVLLSDYGWMSDPAGGGEHPDHAHAREVYCYLLPGACEPRMPYRGPYWSAEQLALYQRWMDDGFAP